MSHNHPHGAEASNPRLGLSIALTLAFVVGEAIAGYLAHSLALMSDAGHNFSDALALILSWPRPTSVNSRVTRGHLDR